MKCTNPACRNYGKELTPGAKFCGICGQSVTSDPIPKPSPKPDFKLSPNRMPQGIALGVDERIVKQYQIGRYSFRKGSIDIIVTNKRVIRYEESSWLGMQNSIIDEINIDSVHGNYTRMYRSVSVLGITAAIVLLILSIFMMSSRTFGDIGMPLGFVAWALIIAIVITSLKPTLEFGILGSFGRETLKTNVNQRGRLLRNDSNSVIFQFKPTPETTVMLKEIGACIYDLKTLGDKAIEKWS